MTKNTTILFRGRNTAAILADAAGHFPEDSGILIVAREGDALAEPTDLGVGAAIKAIRLADGGTVTVIANGGTSAQSMPIVAFLAARAAVESSRGGEWDMHGQIPGRGWAWRAIDVQRDGVSFIAGDAPGREPWASCEEE